jgi:hypothetical protein
MMRRRKAVKAAALVLVVTFAVTGFGLWYHLARKGAPAIFDDPETHFKYGALGLKPGFPY